MIRLLNYAPQHEVVPHAIIWRPISYFSSQVRTDRDDLDEFRGASFALGNWLHFDIRKYNGHPDFTVTVYLPLDLREIINISAALNAIFEGLVVPGTAVAWRRGMPIDVGARRPVGDRLRETEARTLALKIAAKQNDHAITTQLLKRLVPEYVQLSDQDLSPSPSRPQERRWHQIMGNVVSHQDNNRSVFAHGWAQRTAKGLQLTKKGLGYLENIGYLL